MRFLLRPQGRVEDKEEARLHLQAGGARRRRTAAGGGGAAEPEADGDRIRR